MSKDKARYTKKQYLTSKKYEHQSDLLRALLEDEKTYTVEQVQKKIDDFLKKEAK
ncbi:hypothetical protein [Caldalkalibacillus mannanilyticus]|uniref:hypothetical protein n=1 Tax=Caldalkalibacillus mannanilyticus TaxID=1418 RepID=UPI000B195718|nr:hypothetical protein [Caldalkalibacillus mannanilyticus]